MPAEVPAGAEFAEPRPPHRNHFSNVFVLHRASRTVHNDDCVIAISPGGIGLRRPAARVRVSKISKICKIKLCKLLAGSFSAVSKSMFSR